MIGFKLIARGSNNFKQTREAWTEGSMILLTMMSHADKLMGVGQIGTAAAAGGTAMATQAAAEVAAGAATDPGLTAELSDVEKAFAKLAKIAFDDICAQGLDFTLFLTNDIKLRYDFDSSKSSAEIKKELFSLITKKAGGKVGDQVMIYMAAIIKDFVLVNFDSNADNLNLTIDVDL
jgi:hypothetical protein